MELVKVKCPECGANIEINSKLDTATCNYCGTSFAVNKTSQVKKIFEVSNGHVERKKSKTDYLEKVNNLREEAMKRNNAIQAEQWKMINENK